MLEFSKFGMFHYSQLVHIDLNEVATNKGKGEITYSKGRQKLPLNPSRHPTGRAFHPSCHPSI
jgi:hypothetical protein